MLELGERLGVCRGELAAMTEGRREHVALSYWQCERMALTYHTAIASEHWRMMSGTVRCVALEERRPCRDSQGLIV